MTVRAPMGPRPSLTQVRKATRAFADPVRAKLSLRYFKTGPGEYGAGDRFLGLTLPQVRALLRAYQRLSLADAGTLLDSAWHEERLLALLILVHQFKTGTAADQRRIFKLYIRKRRRINNWDLVDASAGQIVGGSLEARGPVIEKLVTSKSVWDRRIAMIATFYDIRRGDVTLALEVAARLLDDRHDLIHKAMGWMLREVGKCDRAAEEAFLRAHAHEMPRTALRYAIEKFPPPLRRRYMAIRRVTPAARPAS